MTALLNAAALVWDRVWGYMPLVITFLALLADKASAQEMIQTEAGGFVPRPPVYASKTLCFGDELPPGLETQAGVFAIWNESRFYIEVMFDGRTVNHLQWIAPQVMAVKVQAATTGGGPAIVIPPGGVCYGAGLASGEISGRHILSGMAYQPSLNEGGVPLLLGDRILLSTTLDAVGEIVPLRFTRNSASQVSRLTIEPWRI